MPHSLRSRFQSYLTLISIGLLSSACAPGFQAHTNLKVIEGTSTVASNPQTPSSTTGFGRENLPPAKGTWLYESDYFSSGAAPAGIVAQSLQTVELETGLRIPFGWINSMASMAVRAAV